MKKDKSQKKISKVMKEFKAGELNIGKSEQKVKNPKHAIAIALSEAGKSKMLASGGMVKSSKNKARGAGIAIKGTDFKGVF
jgi:hypothetical protein